MRLIWKDTYNFYLKWKDIESDDKWADLVSEAHEIEHKFDFDLCRNMLVDVLRVIEYEYMARSDKKWPSQLG